MKIQELLSLYSASEQIQNFNNRINQKSRNRICLSGLIGSVDAIVAASTFQLNSLTQLFIFNDADEAKYFQNDLENLLEGKKILYFPPSYKRSFQIETLDNNNVLERSEVLNKLTLKLSKGDLICTTAEALSELVISEEDLTKNTYELKVGDKFDLEFFIEFLTEHSFERKDFVYEAGEFSIRGGIIDVYSYSNEHPYRIELNGDFVESIRTFDTYNQLSIKKVERFFIIPNIQKDVDTTAKKTFFNYLKNDTIIWTKELQLSIDLIKNAEEKLIVNEKSKGDSTSKKYATDFINSEQFINSIKNFSLVEFGLRNYFKDDQKIVFEISPQPTFHKNFVLLNENLKKNQSENFKNLIFSDSARQIERLYSIFDDLDKTIEFAPVYHALTNGFVDKNLKIACYTEHQIFDRFYRVRSRKYFSNSKIITLKELSELKPGDFVTHIDHGIGKFAGLEKIEINGRTQEAVRLVYKNDDLLYVSINSLHKITRYTGKDGVEPRLHKLGSDTWEKLKSQTKKKVKDIARDLIKLYAVRKAQPGFQFNPDSYLQAELEASFIYEDTPDQILATQDFKKDMESPHPMDRLVCGDVGFGKTEIAIRAAFKAVTDSKQVAVLVPTTILANQHFRTFKERLKDFPCTVDYINRFRSSAEQKQIFGKVQQGKIDILIGTHRMLSKDVKFKDLGLLVIDEEQKFGVSSKEKIKSLRTNVDTLTLTATPIPRTLHFSLMGARDLSIINTAPANRQAVSTELHNYNDDLIKEVVLKEVERGGQVFVVHHRVKDIYDFANRISTLCSGVKVAVAHGQLEGDKLEDVMMKFIEGEYDVLVATTIIESGLDIPNANTIIINNAHMFGLSDLHQMRGRVGRTNKKAFCYLMVPSISTLTADAKRRLQAIEEFSDLGSGFNVAMRDLDIRGAGNLLGGEQSGFIAEIGFEMYHKILDEAIRELKEEEFNSSPISENEETSFNERGSKNINTSSASLLNKNYSVETTIETDFEALIPDEYVRNIAERLALYKQLSATQNKDELIKISNEMRDRFGPLPLQVLDLIEVISLRDIAKNLGFEKLVLKNKRLIATFPNEKNQNYYQSELFSEILKFVQSNSMRCKLKQSDKILQLLVNGVDEIIVGKRFMENILQQINSNRP